MMSIPSDLFANVANLSILFVDVFIYILSLIFYQSFHHHSMVPNLLRRQLQARSFISNETPAIEILTGIHISCGTSFGPVCQCRYFCFVF